jgi:adenine-specific DNA-methyltransferase
MQSQNKVDENVEKIAGLFPNCVTEAKIDNKLTKVVDFDRLKQELSDFVVEGNDERYQFTWPDKKKSILLANAPIAATLRPCREESMGFDKTENLYIEGDNLDVLKLLQETYLGKVKMIYIDPPYNTGNDFVYEDDFAQNTADYLANSGQYDDEGNRLVKNLDSNGRFHTDWLNMIYPRLKLAKDLLTNDGVVFISIDDNEYTNLTKCCDEIFGSSNSIGPIIQNKQNAKNDTINIQKNHELILVYRKCKLTVNDTKIVPTIINRTEKIRNVFEENSEFYYINDAITTRGDGGTLNARPNLGYTVYYNPKTKDKNAQCDYDVNLAKESNDLNLIYLTKKEMIEKGYVTIRPPKVRGKLGCWTWSLDKFNQNKKEIIITGQKGAYSVKKRTFIDENSVKNINGKLIYVSNVIANSKSILDFSTKDGTNVLNETMNMSNIFNNPKNLKMLMYLINMTEDKSGYFLDFFSGSATTAHAVMQLNVEDQGNRKFIMVQIPEETDEKSEANKAGYSNICEIGKERIRRAGVKIKEDNQGKEGIENLDTGFRVLKLDSTNMKDVYYTPTDTNVSMFDELIDNIKEDRTPEDLLYQVMLELGVLLSSPIQESVIDGKKVFNVADGFLMACFDTAVGEETITAIARQKPYYFVMRDSSMASDSVASNFDQIFANFSPDTVRKVL